MKKVLYLILLALFATSVFSQEKDDVNKALNLLKERKFAEAIPIFDKYIETHPTESAIIYNRGLAYMFLNDFDQAVRDFDKSIVLDSNFADAYNNRGLSLSYQGKIYAALLDFNKAIIIDPKFGEAYINRASVFIALKYNDSAIKDLNYAIKLIPKNPELYSQRARLNYQKKEFKKSIDDYTKAIANGMKNAKTYFNRGNANFQLRNNDKAIEDYTMALNLDPKDREALNNRAYVYDLLGKKELAKKDRDQLDGLTKSKLPPLDSLIFRTFGDSKGNVKLDLPNEWISNETKTENGVEVLISPQKVDASNEGMKVGVTLGIIRNVSTKFQVNTESEILDFWKGSTNKSNEGIYKYEVVTEKHMQLFGHATILVEAEMQATEATIPFSMYEYAISWGDNLIYIYFQSPKIQFDYWRQVYEDSMKTLKIQDNLK